MTALACLLAAIAPAQDRADAAALATRIAAVDVYPNTALVTRVGEVPRGDGRFVVRGLPAALDPRTVRLRAPGSEIVALEVLERWEQSVPAEAVRDATARLDEVERALREARDERELLQLLAKHFATLLEEQARGDAATQLGPQERLEAVALAREQLAGLAGERRAVDERVEDLEEERARLVADLGRWQRGETTKVHDVVLDLLDTDGDPDDVELEYQVSGARWEPFYDLRADADLSGVELVVRARVHQRTGEDWDGARIALSTAVPRRRLTPPEPSIRWIDLLAPVTADKRGYLAPSERAVASGADAAADFEVGLAFEEELADGSAPSPEAVRAATGRWADVVADGVNLRYVLPGRQSVPSRPEPSTVLVGRERLEVEPERVCLPEYGTTVWLRGRAVNTSPWVLLEGEASVYLGSTFLGATQLARVQTGAEFDLPLGEDPSVTVERLEVERKTDQPGFLGSKEKLFTTHRIKVVNTDRTGATKRLVVHESLPRSRDERIVVEVDRATPALSKDERWKELGTERGLVTWELDLPPGEERTIELRLSVSYPEGRAIVGR